MKAATRRQLVGFAVASGVVLALALLFSPAMVLGGLLALSGEPLVFGLALSVVYLVRPLFVWPISAVSVLVGYVYGPVVGFPVAFVGAVLTCLPPFLVARRAGTDAGLFGALGRSGDRLVARTGERRGVVAARLAPLPADVISYAAGLSGVSVVGFLSRTLVGEIPWVTAAVLAGSSMRQLSFGAEPGLPLLVGAASLFVLLLAGPAYRHLRGRFEARQAG
jgi:uncharacterized membrane protein YdjX (TVP38/TMEM64 family)